LNGRLLHLGAMGGEVRNGSVAPTLDVRLLVVALDQPRRAGGKRRDEQQDKDCAEDECADADRQSSHLLPGSSR